MYYKHFDRFILTSAELPSEPARTRHNFSDFHPSHASDKEILTHNLQITQNQFADKCFKLIQYEAYKVQAGLEEYRQPEVLQIVPSETLKTVEVEIVAALQSEAWIVQRVNSLYQQIQVLEARIRQHLAALDLIVAEDANICIFRGMIHALRECYFQWQSPVIQPRLFNFDQADNMDEEFAQLEPRLSDQVGRDPAHFDFPATPQLRHANAQGIDPDLLDAAKALLVRYSTVGKTIEISALAEVFIAEMSSQGSRTRLAITTKHYTATENILKVAAGVGGFPPSTPWRRPRLFGRAPGTRVSGSPAVTDSGVSSDDSFTTADSETAPSSPPTARSQSRSSSSDHLSSLSGSTDGRSQTASNNSDGESSLEEDCSGTSSPDHSWGKGSEGSEDAAPDITIPTVTDAESSPILPAARRKGRRCRITVIPDSDDEGEDVTEPRVSAPDKGLCQSFTSRR